MNNILNMYINIVHYYIVVINTTNSKLPSKPISLLIFLTFKTILTIKTIYFYYFTTYRIGQMSIVRKI